MGKIFILLNILLILTKYRQGIPINTEEFNKTDVNLNKTKEKDSKLDLSTSTQDTNTDATEKETGSTYHMSSATVENKVANEVHSEDLNSKNTENTIPLTVEKQDEIDKDLTEKPSSTEANENEKNNGNAMNLKDINMKRDQSEGVKEEETEIINAKEQIDNVVVEKVQNFSQKNSETDEYYPLLDNNESTSSLPNCPPKFTYYQNGCRRIISDEECTNSSCHSFSYCDEFGECVCEKGYMLEENNAAVNTCVPLPQAESNRDCLGKWKKCENISEYKILSNLYAFEDFVDLEKESNTVDDSDVTFYFVLGICCIVFALLFLILKIYKTNFEDNITESSLCKLQIPSWLNVWCVLITVCLLIMIIGFVLMLSHIKYYRQRQLQFTRMPGTPEYYSEHFLDRNHIMVY
uniref:EGF-like domain-containing protein n=1 Tax=Glossina brevipalpis TaxID=37001 RepID=A0A1A9WU37_9MUSC